MVDLITPRLGATRMRALIVRLALLALRQPAVRSAVVAAVADAYRRGEWALFDVDEVVGAARQGAFAAFNEMRARMPVFPDPRVSPDETER